MIIFDIDSLQEIIDEFSYFENQSRYEIINFHKNCYKRWQQNILVINDEEKEQREIDLYQKLCKYLQNYYEYINSIEINFKIRKFDIPINFVKDKNFVHENKFYKNKNIFYRNEICMNKKIRELDCQEYFGKFLGITRNHLVFKKIDGEIFLNFTQTETIIDLIVQIILLYIYLEDYGFVHGDLNSRNIMVVQEKTHKIFDTNYGTFTYESNYRPVLVDLERAWFENFPDENELINTIIHNNCEHIFRGQIPSYYRPIDDIYNLCLTILYMYLHNKRGIIFTQNLPINKIGKFCIDICKILSPEFCKNMFDKDFNSYTYIQLLQLIPSCFPGYKAEVKDWRLVIDYLKFEKFI